MSMLKKMTKLRKLELLVEAGAMTKSQAGRAKQMLEELGTLS